MDLCRPSVCDRASLRVVRRFACLRVEICLHVRSIGRATHCAFRGGSTPTAATRGSPGRDRSTDLQKRAQILTTDGREQVDPRRRGRHVHACARQYARAHATSVVTFRRTRRPAARGSKKSEARPARPLGSQRKTRTVMASPCRISISTNGAKPLLFSL